MSTNFTVSFFDEETNTIKGVYGHWDGYLSHVGKTLLKSYNTFDKAKELVKMGSISSLGDSLNESVFYSRDRGEELEIFEFINHDDLLESQGREHNYLFINDEWKWIGDEYFSLGYSLKNINLN